MSKEGIVQEELQNLGLDPATLAQLSKSNVDPDGRRGSGVAFQYDFEGESFVPKLTLFINRDDGVAVDAALSPATRRYLESLASKQQGHPVHSLGHDTVHTKLSPTQGITFTDESPNIQRLEVRLNFDAEFFGLLQGDIAALDKLQAQEQQALAERIEVLSKTVTIVAKPSTFKKAFTKSDLYRWRELFDIYLQAGIFFSTHEVDHGTRKSAVAAQRLRWFQNEVMRRGIIKSFKLPESREALDQFYKINFALLQNLGFLELNELGLSKILKKFDKRTNLGAASTFPKLILSDAMMSGSMAKAVCAQVSQELVQVVPQVEDYACPICMAIVWRPIRMECKHLLCISCTVRLQRENKRFCPLCRENVILKADTDNIDTKLSKFLQQYFPKEVNSKQIENEIEDGRARFGALYKHPSESTCIVQ